MIEDKLNHDALARRGANSERQGVERLTRPLAPFKK